MNFGYSLLKAFSAIGLIFTLGTSMNANAGPFGIGGDRWKEEVLLHDGQKIIIECSQTYGGRSEPGQSAPIKEHTIRFALPRASQTITWTSDCGQDLGRTNFTFVKTGGTTGQSEDIWFATDPALSRQVNPLEIPDDLRALPELLGYGNVAGLRQVMAREVAKEQGLSTSQRNILHWKHAA